MALLEISGLTVTIIDPITKEPVKLIDNFSLTIKSGELVGIIGETGSGKSVIARILGGSIKDNWHLECKSFRFNGQELLIDHNTLNTAPLSNLVGIIYQDPTMVIDPTQKIRTQLIDRIRMSRQFSAFAREKTAGLFWRKRLNTEIVNLCTRIGIKDPDPILNSYLSELSQTEAHLMAIILTIMTDPVIIIADEPTTGLNAISALRVQSLFKRLNANFHKTILYLSNNFITVKSLVTTAHILYFGQVIERFYNVDQIANDLINYCHHPYTKLFLQSLPNFASNKLIYKTKLYAIPGELPELSNVPVGCRFGPRCQFSQRKCMKRPGFVKDRDQGHSEFACHFPIDYSTPQQNIALREVREKIKREIEIKLAQDKEAQQAQQAVTHLVAKTNLH